MVSGIVELLTVLAALTELPMHKIINNASVM